ncbi:pyruvate decarboxylase 2-like [Camellia sinensis]|uniref:pyruvate decarboxylase 2-like n=1 Tax=Camellia sinensis TaxID=4442 RepID=UPI0010357C88|nr:pyruvate decarboxylase 2-like [Camellia sinensis]
MPSAKGPHFIGTYWGAVSPAFCAEIMEFADAYLFAGPIFNDYSSVGYSLLLKREKAIIVQPERVVNENGPAIACVTMKDFLRALAKRLKRNTTVYDNYCRIYVLEGHPLKCEPNEPLRVNVLYQHIQKMLSSDSDVIAETRDSWFNCQKLKLPEGCGNGIHCSEFVLVYTYFGECLAENIIFLINNGGYTIEVEIHDRPYNVIKNWNYTGLVDAINNGEGKCWTAKVRYAEKLIEAIDTAMGAKSDCLCFIEVIVHKDDTSKELLEWGLQSLCCK